MKIKQILTTVAAVSVLALGLATPLVAGTAYAAPGNCTGIDCATDGANQAKTGSATTNDLNAVIKLVVNILLFIIGALSVIMIVFGGIKYTVSNGNPDQIKNAKNTIMYAVVGLVVAILAYAIVNFVISSLK